MKKKLLIFDLDGTLYKMRGSTYDKSPLKKRVIKNVLKFIALKSRVDKRTSNIILNKITKKYGESISIGLEKDLNIDRLEYFNTVWNIPTDGIVNKSKNLNKILSNLSNNYTLILLSDAPRVWINNVLSTLNVKNIFKNYIFSGEGNIRKEHNNGFLNITKQLKIYPKDCVAIGDQEHSDIIPAKKIGMKTVLINQKIHSKIADVNIKSIDELPKALVKLLD